MALRKLKPISAGQRFVVRVVRDGLHKGEPHEPLLEPLPQARGPHNQGRITTRHQGGGHKRYYRVIDFKRDKDGVAGQIERLEYDPNRSAYLALVLYTDGERRYILAPKRAQVGDPMLRVIGCADQTRQRAAAEEHPDRLARPLPRDEARQGCAARAQRRRIRAGRRARRRVRHGALRSGEMRKVHVNCRATIGEVGNDEHNLRKIGKPGRSVGAASPTVRGVAKNPVDHPHGGGEGQIGPRQSAPGVAVGPADEGLQDAGTTSARAR